MADIRAANLQFSYGSEPVLQDVNLSCERGEFVSILGASGCGKSTLLRIFAGLRQPSSGDIDVPDDTGFVFQKPTLCPWLRVVDNVALPARLRGVSRDTRRSNALESLNLVGLTERDATKLPHQLSGGMRMRASLARALTTKPRVMLMDEPFSALDEVLRQQLSEVCLEIWNREQWTTVFVTHSVSDAVFMSQRIYILAGKPATIVDRIEVPFVDRDAALRLSPEFAGLVAQVGQRLRSAVESAPAEDGASR